MNRINNTFGRIGSEVYIESSKGLKKGQAVISPVKHGGGRYFGSETDSGGREDVSMYFMFAPRELMKDSRYGDLVYEGSNKYRLIRTEEHYCRLGDYSKSWIRKTNGE